LGPSGGAPHTAGHGFHSRLEFQPRFRVRYQMKMFDAADTRPDLREAFRQNVLLGLSAPLMSLPARWLYDDKGSGLFEQITALPEYYPTRTETAILRDHADEIAEFAGPDAVLVEYGAGAALKTEILLQALTPRAYAPVDIAADFLRLSATRLSGRFPGLPIVPVAADFTADFELPTQLPPGRGSDSFQARPSATLIGPRPPPSCAVCAATSGAPAPR
jgi:uncharacterized SAM-dependent methyltransferase